jgi:hypothetical protein
MFVRFRRQGGRFQASVVETRRVSGRVVADHLGGLGSVDAELSIRERAAFWAALPERLDQIGNWIGPDQRAKLLAALRARIPMVTPEEQSSTRPEEVDAENDPEPAEDDIRAMRDALGDDPTFACLPEAGKAALFTKMFGMMWVAGIYDDVAKQYSTGKLAKSARELQKLEAVIPLFDGYTDTHLVQALGEMRRRRQLEWPSMFEASEIFVRFARELVECSEAVEPSGKLQPPSNRPPKALALVEMMVELLRGLGVHVGATGGEGGPATKLMIRMYAYVSDGEVITADAIKDRLKRLKDWKAAHPNWRTGSQRGRGV